MPPITKYTKEQSLEVAVNLVNEESIEKFTLRNRSDNRPECKKSLAIPERCFQLRTAINRTVKCLFLSFWLLMVACNSRGEPIQNRLDKVLESGALRVGTTGDYRPFSYLDTLTGRYEGIDIDLARDLAQSLGAEAHFVATSWPTLLEDLQADKFDIAMAGISKNLHRQQVGLLSTGYAVEGKTPISRCEDIDKFSTLEQIDQPEVTIIVNPGGTNQLFVQQHIKQAQIVLHEDNTSIFQEISKGRADLMITDSYEVQLQSKLSTDLCPTMPGQTFDRFEKTYLMPRDLIWKAYVDAWLEIRTLEGKVEATFTRHLE